MKRLVLALAAFAVTTMAIADEELVKVDDQTFKKKVEVVFDYEKVKSDCQIHRNQQENYLAEANREAGLAVECEEFVSELEAKGAKSVEAANAEVNP